jgi:polyisoprenoid-binding protein YceI|tara:strand:+ start:20007 stop:20567 length:561 start_codon:yes stop_codon:yes gene_type:complete
MKNFILIFSLFFFNNISFSQERSVDIENSYVKWIGKEITTKTHFGKLILSGGNILINNDQVTGEVKVNMESLLVEDLKGEWAKKLEGHLKSQDFFYVDNYKESSLKAISSSKSSENSYKVNGLLTIKDITHPITFDLSVNGETLTTKLVFDRSKYNVRFRSGSFFENLGDKLILDDIELEVKLLLN